MKGKIDLIGGVIPIEGIFHFITIAIFATIGDDFWFTNINLVLAKDFYY